MSSKDPRRLRRYLPKSRTECVAKKCLDSTLSSPIRYPILNPNLGHGRRLFLALSWNGGAGAGAEPGASGGLRAHRAVACALVGPSPFPAEGNPSTGADDFSARWILRWLRSH